MLDAMLDQREMRFESAREKSFAGIVWPHANSQLTPARLAAAGFYAAATQKAPDRVVCFACENALTNWDPTDDPWQEHQTWYPQCPLVQGRSTGNITKEKEALKAQAKTGARGLQATQDAVQARLESLTQNGRKSTPGGGGDGGNAGGSMPELFSGLTGATNGLSSYLQTLGAKLPREKEKEREKEGGADSNSQAGVPAPVGAGTLDAVGPGSGGTEDKPNYAPAEAAEGIGLMGSPAVTGRKLPSKTGSTTALDAKQVVDSLDAQVELLATPISPASKVLAMWEDQVSQTVAAHSGAPQKAPAAAEAAEMPAGVTGSWSVAPLIVEVNGGTLSDKSTSRTRNGAGIVDSGRWGGAGVGKAKKKARASEKGNGGSNNDPDLAAARARGSTEEWAKESEEHESKRVAWAEEEQMWRARLDALRVEEEARTGQTKMVLAQLAAVMGKSMYDMQKTQEQSFALMHQRTTALCARVTAASDRLAAGLTPQWFASKAAAAAAARTEVSELREQEARLTKEVGALGDALAQHSADLKKVRSLETTIGNYSADLARAREEHASLQAELDTLREQVNVKMAERTQLRGEVVDLQDTLGRRGSELEAVESRLSDVEKREGAVQRLEDAHAAREKALAEREDRLKQREAWVSKRDGQVKGLEAVLLAREKKVRELEGGAEHLDTRYQGMASAHAGRFASPGRSVAGRSPAMGGASGFAGTPLATPINSVPSSPAVSVSSMRRGGGAKARPVYSPDTAAW